MKQDTELKCGTTEEEEAGKRQLRGGRQSKDAVRNNNSPENTTVGFLPLSACGGLAKLKFLMGLFLSLKRWGYLFKVWITILNPKGVRSHSSKNK